MCLAFWQLQLGTQFHHRFAFAADGTEDQQSHGYRRVIELTGDAQGHNAELDKLHSHLGQDYQQLFEKNAEAILDGNNVEKLAPESIVKRRFFNGF